MPAVRSRTALCVASVISAGLIFGSGTALAADLPIVGSDECAAAVAGSSDVIGAKSNVTNAEEAVAAAQARVDAAVAERDAAAAVLNALPATDPDFADAQQAVAEAGVALDAAVDSKGAADTELAESSSLLLEVTVRVTDVLCTTETPVPQPQPEPGNPALFADVQARIAALACDDSFNADQGSIFDLRFALNNGLNAQQQGALNDALDARLAALDNCVETPAPPVTVPPTATVVVPPTVVVDPLADDDSVADIDGTQIEVVPNGSISTGAA